MTGRHSRAAAWCVHLFTASGAAWGLLALLAISDSRWKAALGWMLLATAVDAVDGTLARHFRVKDVLPDIDGALLDNLVDYLSYVVVPAFLIHAAGLLPNEASLAGPLAICVASAFQFSHTEAKAETAGFRGFPSYWNVLALYLLLLRPDPRLSLVLVAVLVVSTFLPIYFVYPSRTRRMRVPTLLLTTAWGICVVVLWWLYPEHPRWLALASLGYPIYYAGASLVLTVRVLRNATDS